MSDIINEGISERRAAAVMREACGLITGLNALADIGGWQDGDSVPTIQVRWFCKQLEEHANRILRYLDNCESEPEMEIV